MPVLDVCNENQLFEMCVLAHSDGFPLAFTPYIFRTGILDTSRPPSSLSEDATQRFNEQVATWNHLAQSYRSLDYNRAISINIMSHVLRGLDVSLERMILPFNNLTVESSHVLLGVIGSASDHNLRDTSTRGFTVGNGRIIPPKSVNAMLHGEYEWGRQNVNSLKLFTELYQCFPRYAQLLDSVPVSHRQSPISFGFDSRLLHDKVKFIMGLGFNARSLEPGVLRMTSPSLSVTSRAFSERIGDAIRSPSVQASVEIPSPVREEPEEELRDVELPRFQMSYNGDLYQTIRASVVSPNAENRE